MKAAIVLGAGGFIGSHLVKRLKQQGYRVTGVDLKYPQFEATFADRFIKSDLRDPYTVNAILSGGTYDRVYQLAADMGGAGFIFTGEHDADILRNNALINLNVCNALAGTESRVFYSSSACIYPEHNQLDPDSPNCAEHTAFPANPDSDYGWEKLFSEKVYQAYHRNHDLDVRIGRFHNIMGPCFDEQTEVLTKAGWKFFRDLTEADEIASLNTDNNHLIYQLPIQRQAYHYKGSMYRVVSKGVDQLVTPDHQIYIRTITSTKENENVKTPFRLIKAAHSKWDRRKMDFTSYFEWEGAELPETYWIGRVNMSDGRSLHGPKRVSMEDWFTFIGWYISEGSSWITPRNYTVAITQFGEENYKLSGHRQDIKNLLKRMGIHFSEDCKKTQIIISNKQIWTAVQDCGIGSQNKKIPAWMLNAPKRYLQCLYDALMKGDGNATGKRYTTASRQLADQFQELALKLGKRAQISLCSQLEFRISLCDIVSFTTSANNRKIVQYDGMVYDVTLPKYHVLLVRRHGKVCWSGNCGSWNDGREKAPAAICRKVAQSDNFIEIWGDGKQTRSFLYIDDCLDAVELLMQSEHREPINIGSEEMVSINGLAAMVMDIAGKHLRINNIPGPEGVRGRCSDNSIIGTVLHWAPKLTLKQGLERLYPWILGQVYTVGK